jgi:HlyD family secretion protein
VRFRVDAFPDREFEGRVRQVRLNATNVQNVVTYNVVVTVDNPDEILLPGMTAYVNIVTTQIDDALRVPSSALRFRPSGSERPRGRGKANSATVYVQRDGALAPVTLETGAHDSQHTQVVSGDLREGDKVATGERSLAAPSPVQGVGGQRRFRGF